MKRKEERDISRIELEMKDKYYYYLHTFSGTYDDYYSSSIIQSVSDVFYESDNFFFVLYFQYKFSKAVWKNNFEPFFIYVKFKIVIFLKW